MAFCRTAIEVLSAEVVVFGAVFENMVDGREDRGGDGTDGLFGSRALPERVEQGV